MVLTKSESNKLEHKLLEIRKLIGCSQGHRGPKGKRRLQKTKIEN